MLRSALGIALSRDSGGALLIRGPSWIPVLRSSVKDTLLRARDMERRPFTSLETHASVDPPYGLSVSDFE